MNNPYRWNQLNLDLFFGRGALLGEMLKELPSANGNSFGVTAARRMGKTTVLRTVERDLLDGLQIYLDSGTAIAPVYVDGLTLPRPLTAQMLWGRIHHELCRRLAPDVDASYSPMEFSEFVEHCSRLFASSEKVPKAIVIFDEIEHIVINEEWSGAFFANWRALLSNFPGISGHLCAVFSGAREMANLQHDIGSPLMDVLEWRSLKNLDLTDTRRIMTEPCALDIKEDVVQFAFEETGGHPMILQYVMQKILNGSANVDMSNLTLSISDFENQRSWQFGEWWNKYCDGTSQVIYAGLPVDHSFKSVASYVQEMGGYETSKAIEILQHIGIAELNADRSQVRRRCRMFTRWATKYALNASATAVDSALASLLERLEPSFRGKYVSAWAIYAQDMPNYSGAVSEMRDLVTQVLHLIAPDERVVAAPNFKFERDQTKPTRRQRVMHVFGVSGKEQGKAIASEDELLEAHAARVAGILATSYANASALTHTSASRPLAYTAIKQAESILAQLISRFFDNSAKA